MLTNYTHIVARKKRATARIFINNIPGDNFINKKSAASLPLSISDNIFASFRVLQLLPEQFTIKSTVRSGGISSQAAALKSAFAIYLGSLSAENKATLRSHGFITRDIRRVERKKAGLSSARVRPPFNKR
jgi:small subunit ribosomal protein S9